MRKIDNGDRSKLKRRIDFPFITWKLMTQLVWDEYLIVYRDPPSYTKEFYLIVNYIGTFKFEDGDNSEITYL